MTEIDKLTLKVKDGLTYHSIIGYGSCEACPYFGRINCRARLTDDALKVIDYWKGKYENTLLQQPMIINHSEPIRIEPIDIKGTLESIKTMERLEKVAKKATESLNEANEAIRALREELEDD